MTRLRLPTLTLAVVLLVAAAAPAAMAATDHTETGDLTAMTAPAATALSSANASATAADTVTTDGTLVLRLNSTALANASANDTLLGDEVLLDVEQTNADGDAKTLDVSANTTAVITTEDAVFVAVDLGSATFTQGDETTTAAAGDAFDATVTLSGNATDGEDVSRSANFEVVEPSVTFEKDSLTVEAGTDEVVNATTTLAPGTSLHFSLSAKGATTGTTAEATVEADGSVAVPLSFFTFDAGEEFVVTVDAAGVSDLDAKLTGKVVEAEDATATPTEAVTDTSSTESTESTDETSADGPGFGVAAAVLAVAALGIVARRRD